MGSRKGHSGRDEHIESKFNSNSRSPAVVSAVAFAGLYPNVLQCDREHGYHQVEMRGEKEAGVVLHPTSILLHRQDLKPGLLVTYHQKLQTTRTFVMDATLVCAPSKLKPATPIPKPETLKSKTSNETRKTTPKTLPLESHYAHSFAPLCAHRASLCMHVVHPHSGRLRSRSSSVRCTLQIPHTHLIRCTHPTPNSDLRAHIASHSPDAAPDVSSMPDPQVMLRRT